MTRRNFFASASAAVLALFGVKATKTEPRFAAPGREVDYTVYRDDAATRTFVLPTGKIQEFMQAMAFQQHPEFPWLFAMSFERLRFADGKLGVTVRYQPCSFPVSFASRDLANNS